MIAVELWTGARPSSYSVLQLPTISRSQNKLLKLIFPDAYKVNQNHSNLRNIPKTILLYSIYTDLQKFERKLFLSNVLFSSSGQRNRQQSSRNLDFEETTLSEFDG